MSDVIIPYRFLLRGGTAAALAATNEIVKDREAEIETDTGRWKLGNGVDHYNDLPYIGFGKFNPAGLSDGDTIYWDAVALEWVVGPAGGSPITTAGDLIYGHADSSGLVSAERLPAGTNGYVLTMVAGLPKWAAAGGGGGSGAGYLATSTTSLVTAGSGTKVFTTQAGLAYSTGARIRATSAGTGEWMEGIVSSYSGTTLTVVMDLNSGTGTHADWNINLAGQRGTSGPATRLIFALCDSTQSSKFDSGNKLVVGRKYFDPNDANWGLSGSSVATLFMLLETTNATFTADGDLYRETGAGAPTVVGNLTATASTTAVLVSVNVSSAFQPGATAGIFAGRVWLTTADGTQQVTCSGAWLEIQP